jgi:hypothetical protein
MAMIGAGQESTTIDAVPNRQLPSSHGTLLGPLILSIPSDYLTGGGASSLVAPALASGPGSSLTWGGSRAIPSYFLNLKDVITNGLTVGAGAAPFNGLGTFTAEMFFKWHPDGNRIYTLISDSGNDTNVQSVVTFQMYVSGDGTPATNNLVAQLNISGSVKQVVGRGVVTANVKHHVAMSYDGTKLRLFLDGISVGTPVAVTGRITERPFQDVMLGAITGNNWPELSGGAKWDGQIDSVRLSTVARYVSNFAAPKTKLTGDNDTTLLLNFDALDLTHALITADYVNGRAYTAHSFTPDLVVRRDDDHFNFGHRSVIRDMTLSHGQFGILAIGSADSEFTRLNIMSCGFVCLKLWDNTFDSRVEDISTTTASFAESNIEASRAVGINEYDNLKMTGGYNQFVSYEGSLVLNHPNCATSATTLDAIVIKQDTGFGGVQINEPDVDTETGGSVVGIMLVGPGSTTVIGGDLQFGTGVPPLIINQRSVSATFVNTQVHGANAPFIIQFVGVGAPITPITWISPQFNNSPYSARANTDTFTNRPLFMNVVADQMSTLAFIDINGVAAQNGRKYWCHDCDPPKNPPVPCTSAGARTGSFADGINGIWTCVP